MRGRNTTESWGWVARLLHWSIAAIILFQLGLGIYMTDVVSELTEQFRLFQLHKSWGFVVFVLVLARIAWRLANRRSPRHPPGQPRWQAAASHATHAALYVLMFVLPLSGWVMASASTTQDLFSIRNMVFGLFEMPDPWVPGNKAIADAAGTVHEWAAWAMIAILALHAAAALKHHLVDRDDVLKRMAWGR
ncbi:cytochrome b [Lutibaculum baratangense]|uniref:Cytochrome B561 n=1 Tax=Lutibaculum baratangense AMV1 TaxID=631454 RepID=V4RWC2_9HYPH|nr:cytochrome b [Lutibaculum baratangense]ESR27320.1 cytochrome B561 [Lutibaculum baratangense AMV1]